MKDARAGLRSQNAPAVQSMGWSIDRASGHVLRPTQAGGGTTLPGSLSASSRQGLVNALRKILLVSPGDTIAWSESMERGRPGWAAVTV